MIKEFKTRIGKILFISLGFKEGRSQAQIRVLHPVGLLMVTLFVVLTPIVCMFDDSTVQNTYKLLFTEDICWW